MLLPVCAHINVFKYYLVYMCVHMQALFLHSEFNAGLRIVFDKNDLLLLLCYGVLSGK